MSLLAKIITAIVALSWLSVLVGCAMCVVLFLFGLIMTQQPHVGPRK